MKSDVRFAHLQHQKPTIVDKTPWNRDSMPVIVCYFSMPSESSASSVLIAPSPPNALLKLRKKCDCKCVTQYAAVGHVYW